MNLKKVIKELKQINKRISKLEIKQESLERHFDLTPPNCRCNYENVINPIPRSRDSIYEDIIRPIYINDDYMLDKLENCREVERTIIKKGINYGILLVLSLVEEIEKKIKKLDPYKKQTDDLKKIRKIKKQLLDFLIFKF